MTTTVYSRLFYKLPVLSAIILSDLKRFSVFLHTVFVISTTFAPKCMFNVIHSHSRSAFKRTVYKKTRKQ